MIPLQIGPGLVATRNPADNSLSWRRCHLIRWDNGTMEPFGPWERIVFDLEVRTNYQRMRTWQDLNGNTWTAYLTEDGLYVEYEGDLVEITPVEGITPPSSSWTEGGYGDGLYSDGTYGTPRPPAPNRRALGPCFSLDNFGENLLAMVSEDGKLMQWEPSVPPAPAEYITEAPLGRCFTVTAERHVKIFGMTGSEFGWCDSEDITDWNFASLTNTAGSLPVEPAAPVIGAVETLGQSLFFTSIGAHNSKYIGGALIYNTDVVAPGNVPVSAASLAAYANGAVWMARNGFWSYNGVSIAPLVCDVWADLMELIDWELARVFASSYVHVPKAEIWFMFPEKGAAKNTHVVVYNYRDGWWTTAKISRSCGISLSDTSFPLLADGKTIYRHESGDGYEGTSELPWIEGFAMNVLKGSNRSTFKQLLPAVEGAYSAIRFSDLYSDDRMPNKTTQTPLRAVQAGSGKVDVLATGRDHRLKIEQIAPTYSPWTFGGSLVDIVARGKK